MADLEIFQAQRPRLFSIAYRMLGSASDAEDVLQDAWVRFSSAETSSVRRPEAFAATIVTRLCLDRLKSARAKREEYVGPWLPEPVLTTNESAPDVLAERAESVTLAFLVLLETLSAEERAVFLLKEVFDYEHSEIAQILDTSPANSRQLFHRAKLKVRQAPASDVRTPRRAKGRGRSASERNRAHERDPQREMAARFAQAFRSGDASELTELLAADVTFIADGGGKVPAARRPMTGRDEVVHLLLGLTRSAWASGVAPRATLDVMEVNSEAALVLRIDSEVDGVFVLSVDDNRIAGIRVVRNPEKLAFLKHQLAAV